MKMSNVLKMFLPYLPCLDNSLHQDIAYYEQFGKIICVISVCLNFIN